MPVSVPREIRWIDAPSSWIPDRDVPLIWPTEVQHLHAANHPDFGRFLCVNGEILKDDHTGLMMHHLLGFNFWFRKADGSLALYSSNELPARTFPLTSFYTPRPVPNFIAAEARKRNIVGDGRMPVFYFPNCTILMGVETQDLDAALEGFHPSHRDTLPSDLLGRACALRPRNSYDAKLQVHRICSDISSHMEILGALTGLDLAKGKVHVPDVKVP